MNTMVHYLAAISDEGCKSDVAILLTSFDA